MVTELSLQLQEIYRILFSGSNTGNASSSFVFNVIPPSNEAVLARMIRIRMTFQVQVTGASNSNAAAYNVFNTPYCGFASFPINSCFATLSLSINNASTMIRSSQVLKDLLRYDDPKKLIRGTLSESPCAMDNKRL